MIPLQCVIIPSWLSYFNMLRAFSGTEELSFFIETYVYVLYAYESPKQNVRQEEYNG